MSMKIKTTNNTKQVISRKRVIDHGEVFTSEREVNAMLDLVKQETLRIESRFLEPACGTGNFLHEVLRRKLEIVENRYKKSQLEYERYAVMAIGSIYGIDLLEDNVIACRKRLFDLFVEQYENLYSQVAKDECKESVRFILERNILRGDALTLSTVGENSEPIVFSEWSLVNGSMIKRRDFSFKALLECESVKALPLFSDKGDEVYIPTPIKEFPVTHFLRIAHVE